MKKKWWQDTVVYQIYPKSFCDKNRDGVGDLQGIIEKLPYLHWLGVNVLWLCPINRSPMKDNGYDIADYYQIDPLFGSNADFEELIVRAAALDIRIMMDLVVNHVSDKHPWFQEALRNPDSPYRDYFIFREGKDGKAPNNFRSYFDESIWERVPDSDTWYFHAFAKEQPDLNWENATLRREILDMMIYWQKKGIAGFRIDAIGNIKKSEKILSVCEMEPDGADGMAGCFPWLQAQPGIGAFLEEMRDRVFVPFDSMTVAEMNVPRDQLAEYVGDNGYFSMSFDFSHADIDVEGVTAPCELADWTLKELKERLFGAQLDAQKIGWSAPFLENHDHPRSVNKYLGEDNINDYSTKLLGALFFFLRGTPYLYQGQEIGMRNYPFTDFSQFDDVGAKNKYAAAKKLGDSDEKILDFLRKRSRDNSRTPMQWNAEENAGFSAGTPWLCINPDYVTRNVQAQQADETSVLHFYKKMIALRRQSDYREVLTYGSFEPVETGREEDVIYRRRLAGQEVLVVLNFSPKEAACAVDTTGFAVLLDNYGDVAVQDCGEGRTAVQAADSIGSLKPWQVLVLGRKQQDGSLSGTDNADAR